MTGAGGTAPGRRPISVPYADLPGGVAFGAHGRWLAVCVGSAVEVRDPATGDRLHRLDHHGLRAWVVSSDGRLATTSDDETVLWDPATGDQLVGFGAGSGGRDISISSDGRWLAVARHTVATVWDAATGAVHRELDHDVEDVLAVAIGPDGLWLATATDFDSTQLWDVAAGRWQRRLVDGVNLWRLTAGPDGRLLAGAGGDLLVWEAATGVCLHRIRHQRDVKTLVFSPDGRWLVATSWGKAVGFCDVSTGEGREYVHRTPVSSLAMSPDGRWLAVGIFDGVAEVVAAPGWLGERPV